MHLLRRLSTSLNVGLIADTRGCQSQTPVMPHSNHSLVEKEFIRVRCKDLEIFVLCQCVPDKITHRHKNLADWAGIPQLEPAQTPRPGADIQDFDESWIFVLYLSRYIEWVVNPIMFVKSSHPFVC